MAHRKRTVQLHFMVTEHERELIRQKMAQLGTKNLGVYLRKMAIDGYIVKLELPELSELLSLLRRTSNNVNQVAVLLTYSVKNGIILLVFAFFISPLGLPMLAARVLGLLQDLNYTLRDFITG